MADRLRWGVLGTGKIARIVAVALGASRTGELVAVGSRSRARAEDFGAEFGLRRRHGDYAGVIGDPEVELVYVATPHTSHSEWTIRALAAAKSVLCEKPLGLTEGEVSRSIEAARHRRVFLAEAFAYRFHPQTARMLSLLREGSIGVIRLAHATFGYDAGPDPGNYLLRHDLAGGSILDVGCYTTSMARLIAGVAQGTSFADPIEVKGSADIGARTRVDHHAAATLLFGDGMIATLACAVRAPLGSRLEICGTEGRLVLTSPWLPGWTPESAEIRVDAPGQRASEIELSEFGNPYVLEVDAVGAAVRDGRREAPQIPFADSLGNMATLDRWRASAGMVYDMEKRVDTPEGGDVLATP